MEKEKSTKKLCCACQTTDYSPFIMDGSSFGRTELLPPSRLFLTWLIEQKAPRAFPWNPSTQTQCLGSSCRLESFQFISNWLHTSFPFLLIRGWTWQIRKTKAEVWRREGDSLLFAWLSTHTYNLSWFPPTTKRTVTFLSFPFNWPSFLVTSKSSFEASNGWRSLININPF